MQSKRKPEKTVSAEQIARMAEHGNDVSRFFTNTGKMTVPIQPVGVDFASPILQKLDSVRKKLK